MTTFPAEITTVRAQSVTLTGDALSVDLVDGRTLTVPLAWYPRLWHGTPAERANWQLIGDGTGIHWPDLDEDISVAGLVLGRKSAERSASLQRWLDQRRTQQSAS